MLRTLIAAILASYLFASTVQADDFDRRLELARKYYAEGNLGRASSELQSAMIDLRSKSNEQLQALLPSPSAGWRIERKFNSPGPTTDLYGSTFAVHYRTEAMPYSQITLTIVVDRSDAWGRHVASLLNPFEARLKGYTLIEIDGFPHHAVHKWSETIRSGEAYIMAPGRLYMRFHGTGADAGAAMHDMVARFDGKRVKDLLDIR